MSGAQALRTALDLLYIPSRVHAARLEPLPPGIHLLLRVAVGEETEEALALVSSGRSLDEIHKAAAFFIEQVLLHRDADSYRVLGATPEVTTPELRRNMALLMRWLHPDKDPDGRRSMFAGRVTRAWDDVKTDERRVTYDQQTHFRGQEQNRSAGRKRRRTKSGKIRGEKRLAGTSRVHKSRCRSRINEKESLLRRFVSWVGGFAQPYSR
jgi:hypothetical protein